jgi:hypothetical protein
VSPSDARESPADPRYAGGGIVYDSVEEDEYIETINKLGANVRCLQQAEGACRRSQRSASADLCVLCTDFWIAQQRAQDMAVQSDAR